MIDGTLIQNAGPRDFKRNGLNEGAGGLLRKPRRQGGRRGAYREVFTAFFEADHLPRARIDDGVLIQNDISLTIKHGLS